MAYGRVTAGASYWARRSVARRRDDVRVCGPDEDAVTLALEAAERAFSAWGGERGDVDALHLAVGQGSFVEGPQAQFVIEGLGLPSTCSLSTFSGESLAGVSALTAAQDAVASGRSETILVIAVEGGGSQAGLPPSAAAGAVLIEAGDSDNGAGVEELGQLSSVNFDRWRNSPDEAPSLGDARYLEERYVDKMTTLLGQVVEATDTPISVVFSGGAVRRRQEVLSSSSNLKDASVEIGDFGVAAPLLAIIEGAATPGLDEFLLLAHGTSHSIALKVTVAADGADRFRPDPGAGAIDTAPGSVKPQNPKLSLPTNSPFFSRNAGELMRLDAAKCNSCGWVAYPASQRPICPECRASDWNDYRLPRNGVVYTFTINMFLPSGFGDRMAYVLADLEDGTKYWAPVTDMEPDELEIGMPIRLTVRRFTQQDGVPVYGMMFVSADDGVGAEPHSTSAVGG